MDRPQKTIRGPIASLLNPEDFSASFSHYIYYCAISLVPMDRERKLNETQEISENL